MRYFKGAALALGALALAGCTTTLSGTKPPASGTAAGFAYQLPVVFYELESTRQLGACPDPGEELTFDAAMKATATVTPGPVVVIDHEALGDAFKTTDATFERHPTGMIKSVNVTVKDETAAAITSGLKSVVGIGKLAMGVAIPPVSVAGAAGPNAKAYVVCSTTGTARVTAFQKQKKNVTAATESLTAATEALANFDADHALDNPRAEATNKQREKLATAVRAAKKTQEGVTKAYGEAKAKLVVTRRMTFTPTLNGNDTDVISATDGGFVAENLQLLLVLPDVGGKPQKPVYAAIKPDLTVDTTGIPAGTAGALNQALKDFLSNSTIQVTSRSLNNFGKVGDLADQADVCGAGKAQARCGVIYYTAARGRLQACQLAPGVDCAGLPPSAKQVLLREDRNIPQFGQMVSLSLRNGPWSNNVLTASFTEEGFITTASYKKQAAEAVGALGSLSEGVTAANELAVYRANTAVRLSQRQQARDAAALSALNANTQLLTAQQVRDANLGKTVDDAAFALEVSNATRALRLQKAIDDAALAAKTSNDAVTTSDLEAVQTDTTMLTALKANLEATKALEALRNAP